MLIRNLQQARNKKSFGIPFRRHVSDDIKPRQHTHKKLLKTSLLLGIT